MIQFRSLVATLSIAAVFAVSIATPASAGLFHRHADACCEPAVVCCPPPPVEVQWCVVDPCTGCSHQVSACVPACCAGMEPTLQNCRKGMFGRVILTYKFACCDHCVDVVITKHGRTIVRD